MNMMNCGRKFVFRMPMMSTDSFTDALRGSRYAGASSPRLLLAII